MNPILLALETSGVRCGAALLSDDPTRKTLWVDHHDGAQTHAERLLPMATGLLGQAGIAPTALSAVAFGAGPGGFTGLRVACGVAQGMAMALGIPVVPISTHIAIADAVTRSNQAAVVAVAMDARMGEAYAALFLILPESADGHVQPPQALSAPVLLAAQDLPIWLISIQTHADAALAQGGHAKSAAVRWLLAGDAWHVYSALAPIADPWVQDAAQQPDVAAVARLGLLAFLRGEAIDPADAHPVYVRDKVAYTIAERAEGLGGNPKAAAHLIKGPQS